MKAFGILVLLCGTAAASPRFDIDGDGFDDAVLDHRALYYGSAKGLVAATAPEPWKGKPILFFAVELVGDVNGDGFADVVVGDPACPPYARGMPQCAQGSAYLYLGGKQRLGAKPDATVTMPVKDAKFGMTVVPLGDVDGDKLADVAIPDAKAVHVYVGQKSGWSKPIDLPAGSIQPIGDLDKDGKIDLISIAPQTATIYFGGDLKRTAAVPLGGDASFYGTATGGDFDGDGFGDLAITVEPSSPTGSNLANDVLIYRGSAKGLDTKTKVRFTRDHVRAEFGGIFVSPGDLDGDKRDDLVIVATCSDFDDKASSCNGHAAYVYLGGPKGIGGKPASTLKGNGAQALGDIDGDKRLDFRVGSQVHTGGKTVTSRPIPSYP